MQYYLKQNLITSRISTVKETKMKDQLRVFGSHQAFEMTFFRFHACLLIKEIVRSAKFLFSFYIFLSTFIHSINFIQVYNFNIISFGPFTLRTIAY